jgi:hypothetical protein
MRRSNLHRSTAELPRFGSSTAGSRRARWRDGRRGSTPARQGIAAPASKDMAASGLPGIWLPTGCQRAVWTRAPSRRALPTPRARAPRPPPLPPQAAHAFAAPRVWGARRPRHAGQERGPPEPQGPLAAAPQRPHGVDLRRRAAEREGGVGPRRRGESSGLGQQEHGAGGAGGALQAPRGMQRAYFRVPRGGGAEVGPAPHLPQASSSIYATPRRAADTSSLLRSSSSRLPGYTAQYAAASSATRAPARQRPGGAPASSAEAASTQEPEDPDSPSGCRVALGRAQHCVDATVLCTLVLRVQRPKQQALQSLKSTR